MSTDDNEVLIRQAGKAGRITINRPESLNAVTLSIVREMRAALEDWRGDDSIELVLVDGVGDRAFAAGGDIVAFYDAHKAGDTDFYQTFWREEYELDALIANYPKPYVALMDGITMGGGVGISAHGSHRIVTERSRIAMPETGIGLVPDVGGSFLLSRAPGEVGAYLGLTGYAMNAADAIFAGFADAYVMADDAVRLFCELEDEGTRGLEALLRKVSCEPKDPGLEMRQDIIDRCFVFDSVEYIFDALKREEDAWAQTTLSALRRRSPLCLKAALAMVHRARGFKSMEQALQLEYRAVCRLYENGEFLEGIRAQVIDKDRKPLWTAKVIDDVTDAAVLGLLSPLPDDRDFYV